MLAETPKRDNVEKVLVIILDPDGLNETGKRERERDEQRLLSQRQEK